MNTVIQHVLVSSWNKYPSKATEENAVLKEQ